MLLDPLEILRELVAIPSVNPMGGSGLDVDKAESRLTQYLERWFVNLGLRWQRQQAEPGRDNIVARLDGEPSLDKGGGLILFDVHQDTVPVTGMTIPPWTPSIRDGRLYGRGSCDVKGGMAAMLSALARLREEQPAKRPTVVLACTVNEEYGFSGVKALPGLWSRQSGGIVPRRPDAAIVAEPTDLQVVVAHKGVLRWQCHTRGRAAHSSRPETGDNAIYKMARVLVAIERYAKEVVGGLASHPLCGPATVSVGTIRGGVSVNTIPDHCAIEIDRRLAPQENGQRARRHLIEYIAREAGPDPAEHDPPSMEGLPLPDERNRPLADRLSAAAREVAGNCRPIGVPYATDAGFLAAAGIPTVVFGPGSIAQAHTADEWIALEQVQQAAEIYYRFLKQWV